MATRQTTEYLNSTNGYRTGQRFVGTHATLKNNPIIELVTDSFSPPHPVGV